MIENVHMVVQMTVVQAAQEVLMTGLGFKNKVLYDDGGWTLKKLMKGLRIDDEGHQMQA
jgi:hypothetical protein